MNILRYWKEHPEYWISLKNREEVDREITELFYGKYLEECWISRVIYLDQFMRHFQREGKVDEREVINSREKACLIVSINKEKIVNLSEDELVFVMMPFKHLKDWNFIFGTIHKIWIKKGYVIKDFPILSKFYYDTYRKAYIEERIKDKIINANNFKEFQPSKICEYYSEKYLQTLQDKAHLSIFPKLRDVENPLISLSGGVDSMVLLAYYVLKDQNPRAVHIIYGNREESEEEFYFISKYCNLLQVPLYVYRVEWLKRGEVEREFYEEMTRDIRFMVYRSLKGNVILGHIKDDVIENIWTNIATCKHLQNLKKMEFKTHQDGVDIYRPMLEVDKKEVFKIAHTLGIPYLKNTTPSWSNRGKYRDNFYASVQKQYGESVDNNLLRFAEIVSAQFMMMDKILYQPILKSYQNGVFDISTAYNSDIDVSDWEVILQKIFHEYLKSGKPSIHSIKNFYNRLQKMKYQGEEDIKIVLKKDVIINVFIKDGKMYLKI